MPAEQSWLISDLAYYQLKIGDIDGCMTTLEQALPPLGLQTELAAQSALENTEKICLKEREKQRGVFTSLPCKLSGNKSFAQVGLFKKSLPAGVKDGCFVLYSKKDKSSCWHASLRLDIAGKVIEQRLIAEDAIVESGQCCANIKLRAQDHSDIRVRISSKDLGRDCDGGSAHFMIDQLLEVKEKKVKQLQNWTVTN